MIMSGGVQVGKKIIVHSDGDGSTSVITDVDGNELKNIREVDIHIESRAINEITLTSIGGEVHVVGNVTSVWFDCPSCNSSLLHECGSDTLGGEDLIKFPYVLCDNQTVIETGKTVRCHRETGNHTHHLDPTTGTMWEYVANEDKPRFVVYR